jgi:hypothetical protein
MHHAHMCPAEVEQSGVLLCCFSPHSINFFTVYSVMFFSFLNFFFLVSLLFKIASMHSNVMLSIAVGHRSAMICLMHKIHMLD